MVVRKFINVIHNRSNFWKIKMSKADSRLIVKYGKIGSLGTNINIIFHNKLARKKFVEDKIKEKKQQGFIELIAPKKKLSKVQKIKPKKKNTKPKKKKKGPPCNKFRDPFMAPNNCTCPKTHKRIKVNVGTRSEGWKCKGLYYQPKIEYYKGKPLCDSFESSWQAPNNCVCIPGMSKKRVHKNTRSEGWDCFSKIKKTKKKLSKKNGKK